MNDGSLTIKEIMAVIECKNGSTDPEILLLVMSAKAKVRRIKEMLEKPERRLNGFESCTLHLARLEKMVEPMDETYIDRIEQVKRYQEELAFLQYRLIELHVQEPDSKELSHMRMHVALAYMKTRSQSSDSYFASWDHTIEQTRKYLDGK